MSPPQADLDALIEAMLTFLDLPMDEAYRPGIKLNLQAAHGIAKGLLALELDDEAEPAPVFEA